MATTKRKVLALVKPAARRARHGRVVRKTTRTVKPTRKVFSDKSLFGALPGMGQWAFPLLKELRDE